MVRPRERDRGNLSVVEAMIVGVLVISGAAAIATLDVPPETTTSTRTQLAAAATDAIVSLAELPPTSSSYPSALEEAITLALQGDRTTLAERVSDYMPPGVEYEIFLDNGEGGLVPVYSTGEEPPTQAVTSTVLIDPHWSFILVRPTVEQVAGTVTLNFLGSVVPPIVGTINISGVYVRNSYLDLTTPVSITFPNSHTATFDVEDPRGLRWTGPISPEYTSVLGYVTGYDVPYSTSTWSEYATDSANLLQPVAEYTISHNQAVAQPSGTTYSVHPKYTLSSTISSALTALTYSNSFRTSKSTPDYNLSESATFSWNYDSVLGSLVADLRTIRIYNPAGGIESEDESSSGVTSGSYQWSISRNSLYGTYIAELEISAHDPADATKVYVLHQLATFNVNPPSGFNYGQDHVPPIYRLVINAWHGEWAAPGGGVPGAAGSSNGGGGGSSSSLIRTPNFA